jgi:glutathione peroxidase-family protein
MRLIDLNEDKWISIEEYNRFFANLDQNKDGFVNEKEITDFMKKKQEDESGPAVGEEAPDFELRTLEGDRVVKLSDFRGKKPVVLVFGSYTWPPFRSQSETLEKLYQGYKNKSEWLLVYIREAHPADGWQVNANVNEGIEINQPKTMEERVAAARKCYENLGLTFPAVIDNMDDKVEKTYAAWPDRLYIVDKKGKIAYKGGKGPGGFKPLEMAAKLRGICTTWP